MRSTDRDLLPPIDVQFEFTGELVPWRGPAPYHFIPLPDGVATELHAIAPLLTYGWGVIPVTALVGETEFTTSLFPKDGGYLLPVKDAVRSAEGLTDGDQLTVRLTVRS